MTTHTPGEHLADKKAEAKLDTLVYYKRAQARPPNTLYPVAGESDSQRETALIKNL